MAKVVVLNEYCKSCRLCVNICPKKILAVGDKVNLKGYYTIVVTDKKECVGCALCGLVCPDVAIEVYK